MACALPDTLAQFASGELSVEERADLLDHAAGCESCYAAIAVLVESSPGGVPVTAPGLTLGRYTLGRVIGRGAMGVVHAARDPELDREVALKVLRPQASALRLRREAQALAKLTHPNVVRVYDVGEHDGQTFIAMELVVGENLRQWLATDRTSDEILGVLVRAGRGLAAAHAAGLVHRDFKPDNVLIAATGEVLVGDFGLARATDPPRSEDGAPTPATAATTSSEILTATGAVVGTPAYMAPEQVEGEATPASDQYAFCVTAWEALFGKRPIAGTTLAELRANARSGVLARPADATVPRAIELALRRGLSVDPVVRFASVDKLLEAIAPTPRTRRRWPWLAGTALVAGGGIAAIAAMRDREPPVHCEDVAALISPTWTDATATTLTSRFDPTVTDAFDRYATAWRGARVEACRATHERHEQTTEGLERRVACLDRARDELRISIAGVLAGPAELLPHPAQVVDALPTLERCAAMPVAPAAVSPTILGAVTALDRELAAVEVGLAAGAPSLSPTATTALRERADALAYEPQILRARILEARVVAWTGDVVAAERYLRDVMVRAEEAGDDFARALAGAELAHVIAARYDEATGIVQMARAALRRAGTDSAIEQALLEAEVEIASARGDTNAAAELQAKVVAMVESRAYSTLESRIHAYTWLAALWFRADDHARWNAANTRTLELAAELQVRLGAAPIPAGRFPIDFVQEGDFVGAVANGRSSLAIMRAEPDVPYFTVAQVLGQVAFAWEMSDAFTECLAAYHDAEAAWNLPVEKYAFEGSPPDTVEIAKQRVEVSVGIASCLGGLHRFDEEVVELQHARELVIAGGEATAKEHDVIARRLGVALINAGNHHEARILLEPLSAALANPKNFVPYPRAELGFALARALWLDGGLADRPRALALAADAVATLITLLEAPVPAALRSLPARARTMLAAIRAWQATHAGI